MTERGMPARLKDMLGEIGSRLGMRDAVATGVVWERWSAIVGAAIAEHAEPTSLREGVLRVRVDSPAWATEIGYFAPELVRRVNEASERQLVTEVRVWTGPGPIPTRAPKSVSADESTSALSGDVATLETDPRRALEAAREAWRKSRS